MMNNFKTKNIHPLLVHTVICILALIHLSSRVAVVAQAPCVEGSASANPKNCDTYFLCNHGSQIKQTCAGGLHWNNNLNTCDWPAQAGCNDGRSTILLPSVTPPNSFTSSNPLGTIVVFPPVMSTTVAPSVVPVTTMITLAPITTVPPLVPITTVPPLVTVTTVPPLVTVTTVPVVTTTAVVPTIVPIITLTPPPAIMNIVAPIQTLNPIRNDYKVICYFTDWALYRPGIGKYLPENIDPTLCTHIVYSFVLLNATTFLPAIADPWPDIDSKFYEQVTAMKTRGAKVTLAIGGWSDSASGKYSTLVNDPLKRATFITSIVDFLKVHNFDGLDLDWEYPKCWQGNCAAGPDSDRINFGIFIQELRAALPPESLLSAAVSASKSVISQAYDVPTMSKYLDWIGLMEYDMHGNWDGITGHNAPMYFHNGDQYDYLNVNYSINYWIQSGADPRKLIMGVPLYGQSFQLSNQSNNGLYASVSGPGQAGLITGTPGMLAYYEICNLTSWTVVQDPQGTMGPYAYSGNQWVSYDDPLMIQKKANYVRKYGLGGSMVWALDFDDFTGLCGNGKYPVLTTLSKTLRG